MNFLQLNIFRVPVVGVFFENNLFVPSPFFNFEWTANHQLLFRPFFPIQVLQLNMFSGMG